jgi:hypothetical protein
MQMSLAVETIKDMFNFVLKYPSAFLFKFLINLIILFGAFIIAGGVVSSVQSFSQSDVQAPFFPFQFMFTMANAPSLIGGIIFLLIGFFVILVASLIQTAGFPILVYQVAKKREVNLTQIFSLSLKNLSRTLVTSILLGLIILIPILPTLIPFIYSVKYFPTATPISPEELTSSPFLSFLVLAVILLFAGITIALILGAKLWLTFPILILQRKSPSDSLRASWRATNGYFWSIIAVMILFSLVVMLPIAILNILFGMADPVISFVWRIISDVISGTLGGILATIYYFNKKFSGSKRRNY